MKKKLLAALLALGVLASLTACGGKQNTAGCRCRRRHRLR